MDSTLEQIHRLINSGQPLLLDGGLGGELEARGFNVGTALWSAELLLRKPEAIAAIHRDFLEAGAQCITTSSYQASPLGLRAEGLGAAEIKAVFRRSVEIACEVRETYLKDRRDNGFRPLVAASIGPYGAYLADGSEYRGNYGLDDTALHQFHAQRLHWLDRSGADLIACETLPDLQEARVLSELFESLSTPAWVSFCCADAKHLHDGNLLTEALELFGGHDAVIALGVNCCPPELIEPLIETIVAADSGKLIVVYPNSGQQYDAAGKHWHGETDLQQWSRLAETWYRGGARLIGGCCHVGPEYIAKLAARDTWHC